jgi:hypothetical protein
MVTNPNTACEVENQRVDQRGDGVEVTRELGLDDPANDRGDLGVGEPGLARRVVAGIVELEMNHADQPARDPGAKRARGHPRQPR